MPSFELYKVYVQQTDEYAHLFESPNPLEKDELYEMYSVFSYAKTCIDDLMSTDRKKLEISMEAELFIQRILNIAALLYRQAIICQRSFLPN